MQSRAADLAIEFLRPERSESVSDDQINDPRDTVRTCKALPDFVRRANFRQVNERILDAELFGAIVSQRSIGGPEEDWEERLSRRRKSLRPYIGRKLACVFVRLPGVHYTIEVDVKSCAVAHWEWQAE